MFLAIVIFLFIDFDVLRLFQEISMMIHVYLLGFTSTIISHIRMGISGTNWATLF